MVTSEHTQSTDDMHEAVNGHGSLPSNDFNRLAPSLGRHVSLAAQGSIGDRRVRNTFTFRINQAKPSQASHWVGEKDLLPSQPARAH